VRPPPSRTACPPRSRGRARDDRARDGSSRGASGGAGLALGPVLAGPPTAFAVAPSDVDPASYIIYKDNSGTVNAVNGTTGSVDYSGPNATTVVQNAINNMTNGSIYVRDGTGTLGTLTHKPGVAVILETQGSLKFLNGSPAVKTKAGVPADTDFGTAVDGLQVCNTTDTIGYVRSGGSWFGYPMFDGMICGASAGPIKIVGSVATLRSVLSAPGAITCVYMIPGIYNLGTTGIVVGAPTANPNNFGIRGLGALGDVLVRYDGNGVGLDFGTQQRATPGFGWVGDFIKNITMDRSAAYNSSSIGIHLEGLFNGTRISDLSLNGFGIGCRFGPAGGSTTTGTQESKWDNCNFLSCGVGFESRGVLNRSTFGNAYFDQCGTAFRTTPIGVGSYGITFFGGYVSTVEGPTVPSGNQGIGFDLFGTAPSGSQDANCQLFGVNFGTNTADVNAGNVNTRVIAYGCSSKASPSGLALMGPGSIDIIGAFETNNGILQTAKYTGGALGIPITSIPVPQSSYRKFQRISISSTYRDHRWNCKLCD